MTWKLRPARLLVACLAFTLPAAAQLDSPALRAKFGEPLNRQTFHLPAGFDLVVDYGASQQVCKLQVPALMPTKENPANATAMKRQMYTFLADLVPDAMRGKQLNAGATVMGTMSLLYTDYEHVRITELLIGTAPFSQDNTITVTFKNSDCQSPEGQ
ncbi:MAG TPA: hypothetical protein VME43_01350 [Bryobacteraceae bacterium]|nr:hypothetical protein [Bryobacteraceae bacterium]